MLVEKLVAPLDRRAQRALALGRVARTAGQQGKAPLEASEELRGGEGRIFVSPQGDRLAWLYYFQQRVPQFTLERGYPFVETRPRYSTVVLVSRPDGNQMRVIGSLRPDRGLAMVTWTPDGKRLSFVCDDALWTVPVD